MGHIDFDVNSDSQQCNYVVKKNLLKTCPVSVYVRNDKTMKKIRPTNKAKVFFYSET